MGALEAALLRVERDARAAAAGDRSAAALSAKEYVDSFDPSPALRDFLLGWWLLMGGAAPEKGAASDALGAIAEHGGLIGLLTCLAHGPEGRIGAGWRTRWHRQRASRCGWGSRWSRSSTAPMPWHA